MTDDIKRVTVRIGGTSYQLVSAEDEHYVTRIAARADEMIRRVMQNNPQLSQSMSTVLALVNSIDDLSRVYRRLEQNEQGQKESEKQASEARQELKRMREQNWEMKKKIMELRDRCEAAENRVKAAEQETSVSAPAEDEYVPPSDADEQTEPKQTETTDLPSELITEPEAKLTTETELITEAETDTETEPEPAAEPGTTLEREEPQQSPDYENYTQTNLDDYIKDSGWSTGPQREQQHESDLS